MSRQKDPGPVPNRWLNCPRKATGLVASKFLAFKTPLDHRFNEKVPEGNRFTPSMLFLYMKSLKVNLGLWIDLTNTSRFYDKKEVEDLGSRYEKLECRGHGETPTLEQTRTFIQLVSKFMSQKPLEVIGVHCTHGFNRTGFLLVSYMVEQLDCSVEAAITEFAKLRPPGIYKQDYIEELYRRYDDVEFTPTAPPRPDWCNEDDEIDYDDDTPSQSNSTQDTPSTHKERKSKGRRETTHAKQTFMPGVHGVIPFQTQPRLREIQKKVQGYCKWKDTGFPGSQPVSMNMNNISKLHDKPYRVSWKADGVRFMMLIDGEGEVYMLDRDNCVFQVNNLKFLHSKNLHRHLKNTLLDGEMVVDKVGGVDTHRYLCYDVIAFEDQNIGKMPFFPVRIKCIEQEIVNPRHRGMEQGIIIKKNEPFSVRLKEFWDLTYACKLLGEKFAKLLCHEPDGLIFQPSKEPYVAGQCDDVLKWKPSTLNSIDFRLKIETETGQGILPRKVGNLFVGQLEAPFTVMKVTKDLKQYHNKIIECKIEDNQWKFMRERTDKSFPNSYKTAMAVWKTMKEPVTQEFLLDYIDNHRFQDDSDMMPPPKRAR